MECLKRNSFAVNTLLIYKSVAQSFWVSNNPGDSHTFNERKMSKHISLLKTRGGSVSITQ